MAAMVPTVRRTGPRGVAFDADSVGALYQCFRVIANLGASATEPRYG
jgi:D-aminopeptidase